MPNVEAVLLDECALKHDGAGGARVDFKLSGNPIGGGSPRTDTLGGTDKLKPLRAASASICASAAISSRSVLSSTFVPHESRLSGEA